MLTKHYAEAIGFDIVFFLPDSEEDFASYTEFLQYLGLKNRVGVAKCDDGTTLFLVPPSDFLTKVLKVSGPERLYGVVLKLPHQSTNEMRRPQAASPPTVYRSEQQQDYVLRDRYDYMPPNEDLALRMDYDNVSNDNSYRAAIRHTSQAYSNPSASHDHSRTPEAASQLPASLTPELISALASLIPSTSQSSTGLSNNVPLNNSISSSFPSSRTSAALPAQGGIQESQAKYPGSRLEPISNTQQQTPQFAGQYNAHAQFAPQYPTFSNLPNGQDIAVQSALSGTQVQGLASNLPQASATHTRQMDNYGPSQGQSLVSSNQHYQHESSFASYNSLGLIQATDTISMLNQQAQQSAPPTSSTQGQAASGQNQITSNTAQQLQMTVNGSGNGTSQGDAEMNQRYQTTLQLAASLLQRIHHQQQQQQDGGQNIAGSGNQQ